jgi:hypothetical protein
MGARCVGEDESQYILKEWKYYDSSDWSYNTSLTSCFIQKPFIMLIKSFKPQFIDEE